MPPKKSKSPADLPQKPEAWFLAIRPLSTEIELEDGALVQPHLALLIDLRNDLLLAGQPLMEAPNPEEVRQILWQAMTRPEKSARQKPHRPQEVQFEQEELAEALSASLAEIGVSASQSEAPEEVDQLISGLEELIGGEAQELPGLLSVEGVAPELAAELYAAAAEFYRSAPWEQLADDQPLVLTFSPPGVQGFVQLMGNAGLEFGLVMYWEWEDLLQVYRFASDPLEHLPQSGLHSLSFESEDDMPEADVEAALEYGWEVAIEDAYPLPMVMSYESADRPSREQLVFYQAVLRAVPRFVDEELRSDDGGDYLPAEANYTVHTSDGPMQVKVSYPAGELPDELGWVDLDDFDDDELDDWEAGAPALPFDRRAMEGQMWGLFGRGGNEPADPALSQAQELMYRAWDEQRPRERLRLARQALKTSPDCADAYVLLAEEGAESLEEATALYQKGVQAGERALGQTFFEEYEGDFWGLLETRPYMRARQGLADCLVELGRVEEAQEHYQDMLRLNPGDNQGIRYSMLTLLMRTQQNEQAEELLEQYPDDAFATWTYSRALLDFRMGGDTPQARAALKKAIQDNPHIPAYLTGRKRIPLELPEYIGFGDESEAIHYVVDHFQNWWGTRGAVDWLKSQVAEQAKTQKPPKHKTSRGKRSSK